MGAERGPELFFQYELVRDRSDAVPSFNDTPREPGCDPSAYVRRAPGDNCVFLWNSLGLTQPDGDPIEHAATTNRNDGFMATSRGQQIDVDGFFLNLGWDLGGVRLDGVAGYREQESRLPNTYTGSVPVSGTVKRCHSSTHRATTTARRLSWSCASPPVTMPRWTG